MVPRGVCVFPAAVPLVIRKDLVLAGVVRRVWRRGMRGLPMVYVLGIALAGAGCGDSAPVSPTVTNAANPPAVIPTPAPSRPAPSAEPADSNSNIVSGPIIVEHQVEMTAQHEGIVDKIFVDAPARVKAGTLLAKMDDRQIE